MLARKWHEQPPRSFPNIIRQPIIDLLNSVYQKECVALEREFKVFGEIYDDELLLIISLIAKERADLLPISCFFSAEGSLIEKEQHQIFHHLLDASGLVLDHIFAQNLEIEYFNDWEEITFKDKSYYYRIGREDIELTLEANRLLGDS